MSMSTFGCNADTVEQDFVKEICLNVFQNLVDILDENDISMEEFADSYINNFDTAFADSDATQNHIINIYNALTTVFQQKTGLSLNINFQEANSRGDEVDGVFWQVGQVYELTSAGKRYEDKITNKSWTVWG